MTDAPNLQNGRPEGWRGTILVVDDEESIRQTLGLVLEGEGWGVVQSASVAEALEIYEAVSPDLVVLDHRMPGLTGIEGARMLVREGFSAPIIIFSAYLNPELRDECQQLGLHPVDKINWVELVVTCHRLAEASVPRAASTRELG